MKRPRTHFAVGESRHAHSFSEAGHRKAASHSLTTSVASSTKTPIPIPVRGFDPRFPGGDGIRALPNEGLFHFTMPITKSRFREIQISL